MPEPSPTEKFLAAAMEVFRLLDTDESMSLDHDRNNFVRTTTTRCSASTASSALPARTCSSPSR